MSVGLLLAAAGCGKSSPTYDKPQACGLPTHIVTAVAGTNEISVLQRGRDTFPIGPGTDLAAGVQCEIAVEDREGAVEFSAERTGAWRLKGFIEHTKDAKNQFDQAGGHAGFDAKKDTLNGGSRFEGWWVCGKQSKDGTQVAHAFASSDVRTNARAFRALLSALATATGCSE